MCCVYLYALVSQRRILSKELVQSQVERLNFIWLDCIGVHSWTPSEKALAEIVLNECECVLHLWRVWPRLFAKVKLGRVDGSLISNSLRGQLKRRQSLFCSMIVFLSFHIPALFLYILRVHSYWKRNFTETFFPECSTCTVCHRCLLPVHFSGLSLLKMKFCRKISS